jgi:hypothetical protein
MTLTQELLARAQAKLNDAERALQADPTNKWLAMAVQVAREKVESLQDGGAPHSTSTAAGVSAKAR